MIRKFSVLLCVLIAGGVFLTGCGGDDSSSSSGSTSTPATSVATPPATTAAADDNTVSIPDSAQPAVDAAVKSCKQNIESNAAVKEDIKADLEAICDKAGSGDITSAKEATKEVCLKIVESSGLPSSAMDTAKQACNTAGQ